MAHRPRHLGILGAVFDREIGARLLVYKVLNTEEGKSENQTALTCNTGARKAKWSRGAWTGCNGRAVAPAMLNGHKLSGGPTVIDLSDQFVPDPRRPTTTRVPYAEYDKASAVLVVVRFLFFASL
ncbi:hypothetical protein PMIN01_11280 [Paraphaeosphaeria minitans]|uniref:Uncharacterized protein n=1 Tax=Paraphaeosphaeria minitans TaxID=565426 RepID=A0A9P6G872_9PLEO|nr:hypothetical protein PMIN01_11280 [Paraphaeosphaeria minitans]